MLTIIAATIERDNPELNGRIARGVAIAQNGGVSELASSGPWTVKSQSSAKSYHVSFAPMIGDDGRVNPQPGWKCNCADQANGAPVSTFGGGCQKTCKHIISVVLVSSATPHVVAKIERSDFTTELLSDGTTRYIDSQFPGDGGKTERDYDSIVVDKNRWPYPANVRSDDLSF